MVGRVFISYRRAGNPKDALLIYRHLVDQLGAAAVFMDTKGIRPGDDFVEVLERQLKGCRVLLALIGPDWLQARDDHGRRRLEDEDDFVRVEIRTALQTEGLRVVPVLLDGVPMPRKHDLPDDLHRLTRRQGLPVNAADPHAFDHAMERLVEVLREALDAQLVPADKPPPVTDAPAPVPARAHKSRPAWIHEEGTDDIGRWLSFRVKDALQHLRWIEPGSFWMGSPEYEKERVDDEQRHRVTLSQGFWMADTACTQALWQAVLGDNPSHFQGDPERPVEQVSWHDIRQRFLPAVNRQLPGLDLRLPTEAEWEFACRGASQTPFSFGHQITPELANFDGNFPYAGGAKGLFREKTLPVKALAANRWGLYQMHGNVWEWCYDGYGPYGPEDVRDPRGIETAASRVLRGGSWCGSAGRLRAAYRYHYVPVFGGSFGFRVCRSSPIE